MIFAEGELDAHGFELGDEGAEVLGLAAVDVEVAAGDGAGDEEGAGFDAVGVDAVSCAV